MFKWINLTIAARNTIGEYKNRFHPFLFRLLGNHPLLKWQKNDKQQAGEHVPFGSGLFLFGASCFKYVYVRAVEHPTRFPEQHWKTDKKNHLKCVTLHIHTQRTIYTSVCQINYMGFHLDFCSEHTHPAK